MKILEQLYEGKAKKVFKTDNNDICIFQYKDDATAFNGEKRGTITGKGILNNQISNIIFRYLAENNIPTHFIEELSATETVVKKVDIIPLEVIIRNVAAGSFSKKYGVVEGSILAEPVFELSYKNDALGDPLINSSQVLALQLATREELNIIKNFALQINELLKEFYQQAQLKLIDFKLEFGKFQGEIILADEISPDTCRLWDIATDKKMDKDRFRRDLGEVAEVYQEVLRRIKKI